MYFRSIFVLCYLLYLLKCSGEKKSVICGYRRHVINPTIHFILPAGSRWDFYLVGYLLAQSCCFLQNFPAQSRNFILEELQKLIWLKEEAREASERRTDNVKRCSLLTWEQTSNMQWGNDQNKSSLSDSESDLWPFSNSIRLVGKYVRDFILGTHQPARN